MTHKAQLLLIWIHHGGTENTEVHGDIVSSVKSPCPPCLRGEKRVTISAINLSQINELLQIENGMRHVFPNLPALEHLFRRCLMKVRQLLGKARESSALGVIG